MSEHPKRHGDFLIPIFIIMDKESQIIRLPKKFWELINSMDNEEAWKLIKEIFWYSQNINWLSKIYLDMIKVDLWNLEKSAINWVKWWRPKKESKPQVIESDKPQVIESDNLNERENKDKDNIKKYYEDALKVSIEERNNTQHYIVCCYDLWWKPSKTETVDDLREWLKNLMKLKNVSSSYFFESITSWHTHWKWEKKEIKNFKSSFANNYYLNKK